jgi:hypothetical protein
MTYSTDHPATAGRLSDSSGDYRGAFVEREVVGGFYDHNYQKSKIHFALGGGDYR